MSEGQRGRPGASQPDIASAAALLLVRRGDRAPNGGRAPQGFQTVNTDSKRQVPTGPNSRFLRAGDTPSRPNIVRVNYQPTEAPHADTPTQSPTVEQVVLFQALAGMFRGDGSQAERARQPDHAADQHAAAGRQPAGERVFAGAPMRRVRDEADAEQIWKDATEGFVVDRRGRRIDGGDTTHAQEQVADHASGAGKRTTGTEADAGNKSAVQMGESKRKKPEKNAREYPVLSHPGDGFRSPESASNHYEMGDRRYENRREEYGGKALMSDLVHLRLMNILTMKPPERKKDVLPPGFIPGVGCTDAVTPPDYMPITIFNLLFRFKEVVASHKKYGQVNMPVPPMSG